LSDKTLWILRGCSGSGKTTVANLLSSLPDSDAIAADDYWYFIGNGEYTFDIQRLGEAHKWCQDNVKDSMENNATNVIVHNTNTTDREINPYLEMAEKFNYRVVSLVVENRHGSSDVHGVPEDVKNKQEKRLKSSLKLR